MSTLLQSLYAQKSWADHELFNALAQIDAAAKGSTLHQALRMLNHIHVVDRIFQAHLQGTAHGYTATNTVDTPSLDALHFAVAETDAWYEAHVAACTPDTLGETIRFQFTDGDRGCMTREEILGHVIAHGLYHRGNVGQMLKAVDLAPPRDLYTKFLHQLEPRRRQA